MKAVFVLKINTGEGVGYFDGVHNWSDKLWEAKQFQTYPEAEEFLKDMFDNHRTGGFIQIETYFIEG